MDDGCLIIVNVVLVLIEGIYDVLYMKINSFNIYVNRN